MSKTHLSLNLSTASAQDSMVNKWAIQYPNIDVVSEKPKGLFPLHGYSLSSHL